MSVEWITVLMIVSFVTLLGAGLPLAFTTGAIAVVFALGLFGVDSLNLIVSRVFTLMGNYVLVSAQDGLKVAEAEKAQIEAQGRELAWRRSRTEVRAPADGLVSRRNARIGALATGAGDAMFRIIARGEIELDAEVPEAQLARMKPGQEARVAVAGFGEVSGNVRLVSPEVDKATRHGRVRIFLGDNRALRVGAFARGTIETARASGLAVPAAAVLYGEQGPSVQLVIDGKVATRPIKLGHAASGLVEIREGLAEGDVVVAKSGTFLRDGDSVKPVLDGPGKLSEAR